MDPSRLETLTLSVTALQVLDQCPRLFRYLYLDRLLWPPQHSLEAEENLRKGKLFHRLIELHGRGRSIETQLRACDPQVRSWWQTFQDSDQAQPQGQIFSEIPIRTQVDGFSLVARLDRLRVTTDQLEIVDWKTDRVRPPDAQLRENRQVKIYPVMVCLVGQRGLPGIQVSPERVKLTFWYVNHPTVPFQRPYSRELFDRDRQDLQRSLDTLRQMHQQGYPMTHRTATCKACVFRTRCYGLAPERFDPQQLRVFDELVHPEVAADLESWSTS